MSEPRFRVAIIIVTYNSATVLAGCLASLRAAAQGTDLVEVIVADNMSSDGTEKIASREWDVPGHLAAHRT